MDGDGKALDLVVADRLTGDVSVLTNDNHAHFTSFRYRAAMGLFGLTADSNGVCVQSLLQTTGVAVGDFTGDRTTDAIVTNPASQSVWLLAGTPTGFLTTPVRVMDVTVPGKPTALEGPFTAARAADFDGDHKLDLALLRPDLGQVFIYLGNGNGAFTEKFSLNLMGRLGPLDAGRAPTGLSIADVTGDGKADLLVGNAFGDWLTIQGNGDGTFQAYTRAEGNVPFVTFRTASNTGTTPDGVLLVNPSQDQVAKAILQPGRTTFAVQVTSDRTSNPALLKPNFVALADLDNDGQSDMIVSYSSSNAIVVFRGQGTGAFDYAHPTVVSVGTQPLGILASDLNGDGVLDLAVADQGSNDVSLLYGREQRNGSGQFNPATWSLAFGPRLAVGAGPFAVSVRDLDGDGRPDQLVTTNSQNSSLTELPSAGNGLFRDNQATTLIADPGNSGGGLQTLMPPPEPGMPDRQFLVTRGGTIISYDLNDFTGTLHQVFASAPGQRITFVEPLVVAGFPEPVLFAARDDGRVSVLVSTDGGGYTEAESVAVDGPDVPSALTAFIEGDHFELYVTEAGSDVPVVVTLPFPSLTERPPDLGTPAASVELTNLVPLGQSSLDVVAILQSGAPAGDNVRAQSETDPLLSPGQSFVFETGPESAGDTGELGAVGVLIDGIVAESAAVFGTGGTEGTELPAEGEGHERDSVIDFASGIDGLMQRLTEDLRGQWQQTGSVAASAAQVMDTLDRVFSDATCGAAALGKAWTEVADSSIGSTGLEQLFSSVGPVVDTIHRAFSSDANAPAPSGTGEEDDKPLAQEQMSFLNKPLLQPEQGFIGMDLDFVVLALLLWRSSSTTAPDRSRERRKSRPPC